MRTAWTSKICKPQTNSYHMRPVVIPCKLRNDSEPENQNGFLMMWNALLIFESDLSGIPRGSVGRMILFWSPYRIR